MLILVKLQKEHPPVFYALNCTNSVFITEVTPHTPDFEKAWQLGTLENQVDFHNNSLNIYVLGSRREWFDQPMLTNSHLWVLALSGRRFPVAWGLNLKCPKKSMDLGRKCFFQKSDLSMLTESWATGSSDPVTIPKTHSGWFYLMPLQELRPRINALKIKSIWKFPKSNTNPGVILYVQERQPTVIRSQL